jgi:L-fuconolactonase
VIRIDAHHHVWNLDVRDQPWTAAMPALRRSFDMNDLHPELVAARIDGTILVQTLATPDETPELLALAADSAAIVGVVGWVDLEAPDVADRLAALRELPGGDALVGIRHQVQGERDSAWLERKSVLRGLAAVANAGLGYDLLVTPNHLPAAISVARQLPGLRFVLDHGGKPPIAKGQLEPWRSLIGSVAALPNVAVKLSGLATEAKSSWTIEDLLPYVDVLVTNFGPSRTLFGSDWPVSLLAGPYCSIVEASERLVSDLTSAEQAAIFGDNAVAWYELSKRSRAAKP